ncbi:MAG: hypothetical protein E7262_02780 [Lachnospiraceae bacterium]|nr:hypothetical protein [Lachnospiraceae bacterium]
MRTVSHKHIVIITTFIIFFIASSILCIKQVSANPAEDAQVTTITPSANTDTITIDATTNSTTSGQVPNTRKAPVSISNYSNIITESADTYDYSNKLNNNTDTTILPSATPVPTTDETTDITVTATPIPTTTPTITNDGISNFVFIGDSRTVAIKSTIGENKHSWACEVGKGLNWMESTGVPSVENKISKGTAVIILMGINDLHNVNKYIEYINQKAAAWSTKGAKTYFVSVNPINEATYTYFKNTEVENFNSKMKAGLQNVGYIDTYNYLKTTSIDYTKDGLHYNKKTSQDIYNYVLDTFTAYF